jgi:hypothetical protein
MESGELCLGYEPDSSGYGSIYVSVAAMGFCGDTRYAATEEELRPFVDALARYPLTVPVVLSVGAFDDGNLITIAVAPSDSRGGLRIEVHLRDCRDRGRFVSTSLFTTYPDLEIFRQALTKVIRKGGEAVLNGDKSLS